MHKVYQCWLYKCEQKGSDGVILLPCFRIPSEASRKLPSKQKTSNNGDGSKSSWLLIAVIILAILLLTAIIGLIAIGVLYEKESKPTQTNVTHNYEVFQIL